MVTITKQQAKKRKLNYNIICNFHIKNPDQEASMNSCEDCIIIQEPCGCSLEEGCEICAK